MITEQDIQEILEKEWQNKKLDFLYWSAREAELESECNFCTSANWYQCSHCSNSAEIDYAKVFLYKRFLYLRTAEAFSDSKLQCIYAVQ